MGVVHEAVEHGVGDGGVADEVVPGLDRSLAGDDGGATTVSVLDDLKDVATLVGIELLVAPVVEE